MIEISKIKNRVVDPDTVTSLELSVLLYIIGGVFGFRYS